MTRNKVIRNASWLIGCRIVQSILTLIISMITARYLGPSNYGLISYASSIVAFVVPVMNLGMSNVLVQESVKYPEEEGKIYGTSILISLIMSIVCFFGVAGFVSVANNGDKICIVVCSLYSVVLFFQAIDLIEYWFQSKYLSKYTAVISLCAYFIVSIYKVFLLIQQKDVQWFAISNSIDYMIISFALIITYKKLGGQKLKFSWSVAKRIISSSRYYIVSSLMVTIFAQTDKVMLTLMIDESATGYYQAAVACASISSFVFSAIIDSMRPMIFESFKRNNDIFEHKIKMTYCIVFYLSLAQSIAMTLLAKPIIMILYGESFHSAIDSLKIVVWYTTFAYFGSVRNIWILAEGKQKYLWIINLSGALMNVLINAALIPQFGIIGASIASLVTQFFTNFIIGFVIRPLRKNNKLMICGVSVSFLFNSIRKIWRKKNEAN